MSLQGEGQAFDRNGQRSKVYSFTTQGVHITVTSLSVSMRGKMYISQMRKAPYEVAPNI